ncbi:TetR/AcrR family transcriptional regulator [Mariniluteicoccus flavus]
MKHTSQRGRPRNAGIEPTVFAATLTLLSEVGYEGVSIDGVASAAGVSRPTVYARWANKRELVVAALASAGPPLVPGISDDPTERLVALVAGLVVALSAAPHGRAVLAIHALATPGGALHADLERHYWAPRADAFAAAVANAREAGLIGGEIDDDTVRDALFGPPIYRWLVTGAPTTEDGVNTSVRAAIRGLG